MQNILNEIKDKKLIDIVFNDEDDKLILKFSDDTELTISHYASWDRCNDYEGVWVELGVNSFYYEKLMG